LSSSSLSTKSGTQIKCSSSTCSDGATASASSTELLSGDSRKPVNTSIHSFSRRSLPRPSQHSSTLLLRCMLSGALVTTLSLMRKSKNTTSCRRSEHGSLLRFGASSYRSSQQLHFCSLIKSKVCSTLFSTTTTIDTRAMHLLTTFGRSNGSTLSLLPVASISLPLSSPAVASMQLSRPQKLLTVA